MNRIFKISLAFALLHCFLGTKLNAQYFSPDQNCIVDAATGKCLSNSLLTVVPFLTFTVDARSGGMGDAAIAISPDENSHAYNSSKLAFIDGDFGLALNYTPWLRNLGLTDINFVYLGGYKRLDDLQTIGGGIRFLSYGEIAFTNVNGIVTSQGNPAEFEIGLSYNRKLSETLAFGLSGKYIYSNLASGQTLLNGQVVTTANSFATDLSLTYMNELNNGNDLTIAGAITNLGAKLSYTDLNSYFLPGNLGLGATYKAYVNNSSSFAFSLDFNKLLVPTPQSQFITDENGNPIPNPDYDDDPSDQIADYLQKSLLSGIFGSFGDAQGGFSEELKEITISAGAEYWFQEQFAVRAGYFYEDALKGNRKFITLGAGLKYNVFAFDFSYLIPTTINRSPLDNTIRFTLRFGSEVFQQN